MLLIVVAVCHVIGVSIEAYGQTGEKPRHQSPVDVKGHPRGQSTSMSTSTTSSPPTGRGRPFTVLAVNALGIRMCQGGRVINAGVLVATMVDADGP